MATPEEDTLHLVGDALIDGQAATWTLINGGEPDLAALERWANAMEVLRVQSVNRTMAAPWIEPTEGDVHSALELVQLVRTGASRADFADLACRVYRVTADPTALFGLCSVLPWLAGEATMVFPREPAHPDRINASLDDALAYFERGGMVAGFLPVPEDLADLRRLRDLAAADSGEQLAERYHLARRLWARLPQDDVSAGVRRLVTAEDE